MPQQLASRLSLSPSPLQLSNTPLASTHGNQYNTVPDGSPLSTMHKPSRKSDCNTPSARTCSQPACWCNCSTLTYPRPCNSVHVWKVCGWKTPSSHAWQQCHTTRIVKCVHKRHPKNHTPQTTHLRSFQNSILVQVELSRHTAHIPLCTNTDETKSPAQHLKLFNCSHNIICANGLCNRPTSPLCRVVYAEYVMYCVWWGVCSVYMQVQVNYWVLHAPRTCT